MTASTKDRKMLPDSAVYVADLIDRMGLRWTLDFEYPVPDPSKRVQIRDETHNAPQGQVAKYVAGIKNGEKFPPVVITRDGHIVDGNTRIMAMRKIGIAHTIALVLDESFATGADHVKQRIWTLGAGLNIRNGRGIDPAEIRQAVQNLCKNDLFTATRAAALLGVTEGTINDILAEGKAKARCKGLGLVLNGGVPVSTVRRLGKVSDKLHDAPFKSLANLMVDSGMGPSEASDIIRKVKVASSDDDAMQIIEAERSARLEQISMFKASGRSRPPLSAQLRQRLGFILSHSVDSLVEYNPNTMQEHLDKLRAAVTVMQSVIDAQEASSLVSVAA